jgi:ABC-2 type transport system ATP-binding protein
MGPNLNPPQQRDAQPAHPPSPPLRIDGLQLDLGGRAVLRDIELSLEPGDLLALVGPNGSGKSSLIRCIAGLLSPAGGRIEIGGFVPATHPAEARHRMGLAVDPTLLPGLLSGRECLALFARARGLPAIPESSLQLAESLRFAQWLEQPVETCSLGTRQKLGVLLGLIGEPPLLLLDEPLNGLDPPSAWALKEHLVQRAAEGAAIVLATHAIELAERHVNRALLLVEGRVRRLWSAGELVDLRADPLRSLEAEMVAAMV